MTTVWQPGTLYQPGQVVVPTAAVAAASAPPDNAGFEGGDADWTKGTGWAINNDAAFVGDYSAVHTAAGTDLFITNDLQAVVTPGQSVSARCLVYGNASDADATVAVCLRWYDSVPTLLSTDEGSAVGGSSVWKDSRVTATAPADAAFVSIAAVAQNANGVELRADSFTWNHVNPTEIQALAFKSISTAAGLSASTEPTWPTVVSGTVVDGEVTWEAFAARTVTWEASPNLVSGATEPVWPIAGGAFVSDGSIAWKAVPFRIEDENCPNTKVVAIGASKIFAGDDDVVRFCATLNPRDWTTAQDAGFLPSGLQQKGQVGVEAMGIYRGNLTVYSASTFQMWQIDPDPASMALLDSMEGIGTTYYKALQPVSNDLFMCAALGVRTVGLTAGSGNLQAGDVGLPIDSLIQAAVNGKEPLSTYYPSAGQYWITTANEPPVPIDPPLLMACPVLGDAPAGEVFSYTPTVTNGGELTFEITDGTLPPGLSLDPVTGEISGTPTVEDEYDFTLTVTSPGYTSAQCIHVLDTRRVWFSKNNHGSGLSATADFVRSPDGADWSATGYTAPINQGVTRFYYFAAAGIVLGIRASSTDLTRSSDKGFTWTNYSRGVSTAAGNVGMTYDGEFYYQVNSVYPVSRSDDLITWTNPDSSNDSRAYAIVAMDGVLYCVGGFHTIYSSSNQGVSWASTGQDAIPALPAVGAQSDALWVNSARDFHTGAYSIYCVTSGTDHYVYKFVGDVSSPTLAETIVSAAGFADLKTDGGGGWVILMSDGAIWYSADEGDNWTLSGDSVTANGALDSDGTTFAIAHEDGISYSADGGANWTLTVPSAGDLSPYTGICAMT